MRSLLQAMFVALFLVNAAAAVAAEAPAVDEKDIPATVQGVVPGAEADADAATDADRYIHWDFITCVHDTHECQWEAHYHGFHYWKVEHDHWMCGSHMHYACYGGHH